MGVEFSSPFSRTVQFSYRSGRMELPPSLPSANLFIRQTWRLNPQPRVHKSHCFLMKHSGINYNKWVSYHSIHLECSSQVIYSLLSTSNPNLQEETRPKAVNPRDRLKFRSNFSDHLGVYIRGIQGQRGSKVLNRWSAQPEINCSNKRNQYVRLVNGVLISDWQTGNLVLKWISKRRNLELKFRPAPWLRCFAVFLQTSKETVVNRVKTNGKGSKVCMFDPEDDHILNSKKKKV